MKGVVLTRGCSCLAVAALVAAWLFSGRVEAEVPSYTVLRTDAGIVIDGVLDEADWAKAQPVGAFFFPWWTAGEKEPTEAKLLWDDNYLYLAIVCSDRHIWADHYSTNDWTYNDDCAELFWFPGTDTVNKYYTFEINCLGNLLSVSKNPDYSISDRRSRVMVPRIGRTVNGTVNNDSDTDTGWTLEVAIKYTDYPEFGTVRPSDGTVWRAGINRCGGKTNAQYSQWSASQTMKPNFHVPADFGKFVFSSAKVGTGVGVERDTSARKPEPVSLADAFPNPFNAATTISFALAAESRVTLAIYSVNDQKIRTLIDSRLAAGDHHTVWDGIDDHGRMASSGVYFIRLRADGQELSRRMTLLK